MKLVGENGTYKFGEIISKNINQGVVVALIGDLGSGKTTLAKSIIKNMIDIQDVPSPTFNIVNEYNKDNITIYHFDLYRLEDEGELFGIGFDDYISNKKAIIIIEWADKFIDVLPKNYIKINFEKSLDCRYVDIVNIGEKYKDVVDKISSQVKEYNFV